MTANSSSLLFKPINQEERTSLHFIKITSYLEEEDVAFSDTVLEDKAVSDNSGDLFL